MMLLLTGLMFVPVALAQNCGQDTYFDTSFTFTPGTRMYTGILLGTVTPEFGNTLKISVLDWGAYITASFWAEYSEDQSESRSGLRSTRGARKLYST